MWLPFHAYLLLGTETSRFSGGHGAGSQFPFRKRVGGLTGLSILSGQALLLCY